MREFYEKKLTQNALLDKAISVAEFFDIIIYSHRLKASEYERLMLMKKACERTKNTHKLFIPQEFFAFLKNNEYLFSFFKELALANKSVEDLRANGIKPTILLTRPHTNAQDSWLQASELVLNNEPYVINERGQSSTKLKKSLNRYAFKATLPELEKGRWQVKLNAQKNENSIGFYEFNLLVSEP